MSGFNYLYFPMCALLISLLITILYFNRQRVNNKETKLYRGLVLINFLESIIACVIVSVALLKCPLWLLVIINILDNTVGEYPSYFQIRNFYEQDLELLFKFKKQLNFSISFCFLFLNLIYFYT